MKKICHRNDLIFAFRGFEQKEVIIPYDFSFPFKVQDILYWSEPGGVKSFLILNDLSSHQSYGVIFRKTELSQVDPQRGLMCDWCYRIGSTHDVSFYSVKVSDKKTIGVYLCKGLSCKDHLKAAPSIHGMRETVKNDEKLERLLNKITQFYRNNIF